MNGQTEHADNKSDIDELSGNENSNAPTNNNGVTGDDAAPGDDPQGTVADPLAELQAKADENWNKYLRTAAELENVRKRAARDVDNARKFALEQFGADMLDVRDSLELGLEAGEDAES